MIGTHKKELNNANEFLELGFLLYSGTLSYCYYYFSEEGRTWAWIEVIKYAERAVLITYMPGPVQWSPNLGLMALFAA